LSTKGVLATSAHCADIEENFMTVKGVVIASAVAGLFAAMLPAVAQAKESGKVKCAGINSCKGKSACKGASACKSANDCKGKGVVETSAEECQKKKGTIVSEK
jgi:hypothetical protein